jgi:hypothetical protein
MRAWSRSVPGLTLLSGLLFGALPALRATRLDLIAVIKENARSGVPAFGLTGGQLMVAAQTALAMSLLGPPLDSRVEQSLSPKPESSGTQVRQCPDEESGADQAAREIARASSQTSRSSAWSRTAELTFAPQPPAQSPAPH